MRDFHAPYIAEKWQDEDEAEFPDHREEDSLIQR
jgi:hypothetical protein